MELALRVAGLAFRIGVCTLNSPIQGHSENVGMFEVHILQ